MNFVITFMMEFFCSLMNGILKVRIIKMNILCEVWWTVMLFTLSNFFIGFLFDMSNIVETGNIVGNIVLKTYFAPAIFINRMWGE